MFKRLILAASLAFGGAAHASTLLIEASLTASNFNGGLPVALTREVDLSEGYFLNTRADTVTAVTVGATAFDVDNIVLDILNTNLLFYVAWGGPLDGGGGVGIDADDYRIGFLDSGSGRLLPSYLAADEAPGLAVAEFRTLGNDIVQMDVTAASLTLTLLGGNANDWRFPGTPFIPDAPDVTPPPVDPTAPIPLPAASWLLLAGLGALCAVRRAA